jgi:hypothetical protein
VFLGKDRTMNNVHKHNICTNVVENSTESLISYTLYLSIYLSIYMSILSMTLQPFVGSWLLFQFLKLLFIR